jgi:nitroimidazol reductase NimA-like FMN-containing flavoprotein (pyridoxamine 5'-phosphate oxidase superfamily)
MAPTGRVRVGGPSARTAPGPVAPGPRPSTRSQGTALRPRELTTEECRERLAAGTTGRIGWSSGGVQQILPVSYAVHAGRVVFRTSPYGVLHHLSHPTNVAFEIDQVDAVAGTGWSVVVQGRAEGVVLPQELVALWARPDIEPWAPGTRNLFIAITTHTISGRVVHAPSTA